MRIIPGNDYKICYDHFCRQQRGGDVFQGARWQKGSGLFGKFERFAIPYMQPFLRAMAVKASRYLGRNGGEFITDLESGAPFKEAAKQRLGEIKSDILKPFTQGGSGRRRRRRKPRLTAPFPAQQARRQKGSGQRRGRKRTRRQAASTPRDIFAP